MIASQFREVVEALNQAHCRYLVAGGFAVIAHGYLRYTGDIDLILDLEQTDAARAALNVFAALGYRPRVPVPLESFLDAALRESWQRDKDMLVFSLIGPGAYGAVIDLFLNLPFPFAQAYRESTRIDIGGGLVVPFVDRQRLRDMKRKAGRPKDLEDLRNLGFTDG
jgi:hypothetical protein